MRAKRTAVVLVALAALAGCDSSDHGSANGLTSGQRASLIQQLEAARSAAATRNLAATEAAVGRFRQAVLHLRRTGALSNAQARALRIGAARVLARVKSDNSTPQPAATTPAPAPTPAPAATPKHEKKHKPGKDHGKGPKEGDD